MGPDLGEILWLHDDTLQKIIKKSLAILTFICKSCQQNKNDFFKKLFESNSITLFKDIVIPYLKI